MTRPPVVIEGCAIATMDGAGTEHASGHLVVEDGEIVAVGSGPAPQLPGARRVDGRDSLLTPGLVNCHHHLFQWLTRGLAQQRNLFEWLGELLPVWGHLDPERMHVAAQASLAALARSGCTTAADHPYLFPTQAADLLAAEVDAAGASGLRLHVARGSMDLGTSRGGLPPDELVEDRDAALAETEAAIDRFHDPSPGSRCRVAVAPCAPFAVTPELMTEAALLARSRAVRLHTHLAETAEEDAFCRERFGVRPVEYLADLGWLGDDVWLAHCVHLDDEEVRLLGRVGTGVAHCPTSNSRLGAGIAPVRALLRAGAPVGLGVDGAASNEVGALDAEMHQALLAARLRDGPAALTARGALSLATREGARCLGRSGELGSLEVGKLADVALWRLDGLDHRGIADPVTALVFGPAPEVALLLVGGDVVVEDGELRTLDEAEIAKDVERASREIVEAARDEA